MDENANNQTTMQAEAQPVNNTAYASPVQNTKPVGQLRTNRGLLKTILLSIITLGIYGIVVYCNMSSDINTIAQRYDGKKTMHYALVIFVFSWLSLMIVPIVWLHKFCARMGNELKRRGIDYNFSAKDMWLWGFLGTFILVGPFIFGHKMFVAMNKLCADYNEKG